MSKIRIYGSSSGYSEISAPINAGDQSFTFPTSGGEIVTISSTQTLTNKTLTSPTITSGIITSSTVNGGTITSGTAVSAASTMVNFTDIPSWVKRVTVMFNGVSTNGTSVIEVRVGTSSGVVATGYNSHCGFIQASAVGSNVSTTGYVITSGTISDILHGNFVIATAGSNIWHASSTLFRVSTTNYSIVSTGTITLGGTLDRVRITTANGTDTFDAGTINLMYEG